MCQQKRLFHVGATAPKVRQRDNGTNQHRDETQGEERLSGHHETRNEEVPDLVISGGEGFVNPATVYNVARVSEVVRVHWRAEAVRPETQVVQFSPNGPVVGVQPVRGGEGYGNKDEADREEGYGDVASQ